MLRAAALTGLSAIALIAAPHADGARLGDASVSKKAVEPNGFWMCRGAALDRPAGGPRPWVNRRSWNPAARPVVPGDVTFAGATFTTERKGRTLEVSGSGTPAGSPAGSFPAPPNLAAYPETQRSIAGRAVRGTLPDAARRGRARCVRDRIIGIAVNGVPLLAPVDLRGRDLVAREVPDSCGGVVTEDRLYGYRVASPCIPRAAGGGHGSPIGFARDGFWIYGPGSKRPKNLDACGGHTHRISLGGGGSAVRYHRHASNRFPYLLGCLRGKPGALAAPAAGDRATAISASPGLTPAFDPSVSDYVVRCTGAPVELRASTGPSESVSVDGDPFRSGEVAARLPLAEGQAFSFTLQRGGSRSTHHVRCLPGDFPPFTYERNGRPTAAFQIVTPATFASSNYVAVFDRNGVPVWWFEPPDLPLDAALSEDGHITWARYFGGGYTVDPRGAYEVRRLDGTLVRTIETAGSPVDHHDLVELPGGNVLAVTYKPRSTTVDLTPYGGPAAATVVDAEVQEVSPAGAVVWSWNSRDHIALSETGRWWPTVIATPRLLPDGRSAYDPVHINSVDPDGDDLVISTRNTDSLYKIDRATGNIVWKLGGTTTADSLNVVGDPLGGFPLGAQHDARVLGDGTITIHDNRSDLGQAPRGVRYAIDETAGTATYVESVSDPRVPASACCGSARRQPNGNWVISWGGSPITTELEPDGDRVFQLAFTVPPTFTYRSYPVPDGRLDASALRGGMDAMHPRP